MKIGISGAGGHLGRATVKYAMERIDAANIVAISRGDNTAPGVEKRRGDYDDPSSLERAYAGIDRLMLIPTTDLRPGVRAKQIGAAIDAAVAAGVKHILYLSTLGAKRAAEPNVLAGYFIAEQALMKKAPAWTILRMGYYMESFIDEVKQSLPYGMHMALGDVPVAYVSRDDLAEASASILSGDGHDGAIYQGTGAETLTPSQRAAMVASVTGKPFMYAPVTAEQYAGVLQAAKLPPDVVNTIVSIQSGFANGTFDLVSGDIARLCGRKPRALQSMLEEALG